MLFGLLTVASDQTKAKFVRGNKGLRIGEVDASKLLPTSALFENQVSKGEEDGQSGRSHFDKGQKKKKKK